MLACTQSSWTVHRHLAPLQHVEQQAAFRMCDVPCNPFFKCSAIHAYPVLVIAAFPLLHFKSREPTKQARSSTKMEQFTGFVSVRT
jgi:hypothetical protein